MNVTQPQLSRPRIESGVDYGSERLVILRVGRRELIWHRGGKVWAGRGFPAQYYPGKLIAVEFDKPGGVREVTSIRFHEGGKLSKLLLRRNSAKINEFFAMKIAEHLDPKLTTIIAI